jgi:hypothetical protein
MSVVGRQVLISVTAEATVEEDGCVKISLPAAGLAPGARVQVAISPSAGPDGAAIPSLRGTVIHYADPFGPAIPRSFLDRFTKIQRIR